MFHLQRVKIALFCVFWSWGLLAGVAVLPHPLHSPRELGHAVFPLCIRQPARERGLVDEERRHGALELNILVQQARGNLRVCDKVNVFG